MFRFVIALLAVAVLAIALPVAAPAADFFVANADGTFSHVRTGPFVVRSYATYGAPVTSFSSFGVRSARFVPFGVYSLSDPCHSAPPAAAPAAFSVPFGVRSSVFILH